MSFFASFGRRKAIIAAGAMALALAVAPAMASPKIGAPAPDFTGVDSSGKTVKLSDFKGKTVILEWTNHDCPYVKKHYRSGNMQGLQKQTTAKGIVWISIISSAPGEQGYVKGLEADELTEKRGAAPTKVVIDPEGKIGRMYDARTTPHMYIIKPDGMLAYKGAIDSKPTTTDADVKSALNYVQNALKQISAGKPVDPAVTRAYGCSVKYAS